MPAIRLLVLALLAGTVLGLPAAARARMPEVGTPEAVAPATAPSGGVPSGDAPSGASAEGRAAPGEAEAAQARAAGSAAAAPRAEPAAPAARVVVFGDSLATGVAAQLRAAGQPVTDLGKVSWGVFHRDLAERAAELRAAAAGAETVVLFLGTNDQGRRGDALRERLETLRAAIPAGIRVVWLGQPRLCRPRLAAGAIAVTGAIRDTAARHADAFVAPTGGCNGDRAADGVHFTPRGYRLIARQLRADAI